jgi:hypothetical protein
MAEPIVKPTIKPGDDEVDSLDRTVQWLVPGAANDFRFQDIAEGTRTPPICDRYCVLVTVGRPGGPDDPSEGAPGLAVSLYKGRYTPGVTPPSGDLLASGTTDGDGYFCYDLPDDGPNAGIRPRFAIVTAPGDCLRADGAPLVTYGYFSISPAPVCQVAFAYCHVLITADITEDAHPTITVGGPFGFRQEIDEDTATFTACYLVPVTSLGSLPSGGLVTMQAETLSGDQWNGSGWSNACQTLTVACGGEYSVNLEQDDYSDCFVPATAEFTRGGRCGDDCNPLGLMSKKMEVRLSAYPSYSGGTSPLGKLEGVWTPCDITPVYGFGGLSHVQQGWIWDSGCVSGIRVQLGSGGLTANVYSGDGCGEADLVRTVAISFRWNACSPCDLSFTADWAGTLVLVEIRETCDG